jgi:uncharacterized protein
MPNSSNTPSDDGASAALSPDDFDTLDDILDELRTRNSETPQWEFCEGFMAALICGRRIMTPDEYLPVLLDTGEDGEGKFADDAQFELFFKLWSRRWKEITASLDADVESLEDDRAFYPQVMDVRGVMASLSEEERATAMRDNPGEDVPAFGQVWALGFMFAVEAWPDDWVAPPKDKDAIKWLNTALGAMVALTEDDDGPLEVSVLEQEDGKEGPPSMSKARLEAFGEAVWAVYDLREMWQSIGPRVEQVFKTAEPGRNDLCHCGSGRKYKKCHGMN